MSSRKKVEFFCLLCPIWVIYYLSHLLLRLCSFVQSDARTSPNSGAFPIELWRLLKKCFPNMDRQHDEILYFFVVIPTQDTSDVRNKGLCQPFGFLKRKGELTNLTWKWPQKSHFTILLRVHIQHFMPFLRHINPISKSEIFLRIFQTLWALFRHKLKCD